MAKDQTVVPVLPGVELFKQPRSRYVYCRVWNKGTQDYIRRSTGQLTNDEAKAWVLSNLQELFSLKPTPRGGGANSIKRHLVEHLEFLRKRQEAGEISESTFEVYQVNTRHFLKWFAANDFKKLSDLKRTSLQNYGIDMVSSGRFSRSTAKLHIVFLRMWWKYLQETEVLERPLTIRPLRTAIENRTGSEPFSPGDLKKVHRSLSEWLKEVPKGNNNQVSKYNKLVFSCFIRLLEESGARQHEVLNATWRDVNVGVTNTRRERTICQIRVPHSTKRGFRWMVFRGDALLELKKVQRQNCPEVSDGDFIFRNHQTNTLIDRSTFSRYWSVIQKKADVSYPLHTFRAHRITELIMSGVEIPLVARNCGLSQSQISKSYLRYTPAAHFEKLIQQDSAPDKELWMLMLDGDD